MQVAGQTIDAAQAHRLGELAAGNARRFMAHQRLAGEHQKLRVGLDGFAVPALKAVAAAHIGGQLLFVEGINQRVIDQHVLAAGFVL